MHMPAEVGFDTNAFSCQIRPNRSLTPRGRMLWLILIALNAIVISMAAMLVGAWPVVPFAGLEVFLLGVAFWWIGRHDDDIESFSVQNGEFLWECRVGNQVRRLSGNAAWAQIENDDTRGKHGFVLAYSGAREQIGLNLPESHRVILRNQIVAVFRAARA
jgi:uncharacterized membrane protein